MNHLLLKTFFIIFLNMLLPPLTQTANVYVSLTATKEKDCGSTKDDPCRTIKAAMQAAKSNSQITIMASGTATTAYNECPVIVTKPFTFTGIQGIPVIDCKGKVDAFIINFGKKELVNKTTKLVVNVKNLKIRNAKTAIFFGMRNKITNVRIFNVSFEGNSIDIKMKGSPLCFLSMDSVVASGTSGDGIQFDSCGEVKATLTNTKFHGKYFKVVSTKRTLGLTMREVTFDMRTRLNSFEVRSPVYIETARGNTKINIRSSRFLNHAGKTNGSVCVESPRDIRKHRKLKASIVMLFDKVIFGNNSVTAGNGGAFWFNTTLNTNQSKPAHVNFQGCTFRGNSASFQGGALWFGKWTDKTIQFTDCTFRGNRAYGSGTGRGGALFSIAGGKILIENSRFQGNSASKTGGTLHLEGDTILKITDSYFQNNRDSRYGTQGDIMYVDRKQTIFTGKVIFDLQSANFQKPIFSFEGRPRVLTMSNSTRFICPIGYNYEELGVTSKIRKGSYHFFGFKCVPCQDLFYSVSRGYHQVNGSDYRGKCHKCPYGASCNGTIRARANFWGMVQGDKIKMVACPRGYCCEREPCQSYDSCCSHRTGTLCGHCEDDFSEGISSPVCYSNQHCTSRYAWIFLLFSIVVVYVVCLFQQEIIERLTRLLLWNIETDRDERQYRPRAAIQGGVDEDELRERNGLLSSEDRKDEEQLYERGGLLSSEVEPVTLRPAAPDYNRIEESKSFNNTGGYIKVFFYFYQVVVLLRVSSYSSRSSFPGHIIEFMIPFLNFQFTDGFSDCLFENLTPVNKTLFKNSVCYWVLLLAFLSYFFYKTLRWIRTRSYSEPIDSEPAFKSRSFPVRLTGAIMQIILLSYFALAQLTVKLLHCVEVDDRQVLYIDGSVVCYREPLQVFIWLFFFICIFPFFLVLIFGRKLLISGHLSPGRFILACFFPLIFLLYWVYLYWRESHGKHMRQTGQPGRDPYKDKILYILQHPYRDAVSRDTRTMSESLMENWESIMMLRRLVLVMAFIFANSFLLRAYLLFIFSFCILMLHVSIQPFVNKSVNTFETVSLSVITLFSGFSIAEAAFSTAGQVSPLSSVATMQAIQDWLIALLPFCVLAFALSPRAIYHFHRFRLRYQQSRGHPSFQPLHEETEPR